MMQHAPSHTSDSTSTLRPVVMITDASSGPLRPVVMITGASSGIGRALAVEFAARGHDLLLIARGAERLALTAAQIRTQYQVQIDCLVLDVAARDAPKKVSEYTGAHNLEIRVLVNNAACWMSGPLATNSHEATSALIRANMAAPLALIRAVLPAMIARRDGAILNVGSLAGELPSPGAALYSASKSFMRSMTLALRHELAGSGITVSLLVPGAVRTDLTSDETRMGSLARAVFALSPTSVARVGYLGMKSGQRIIIPGLHVWIIHLALKVLPHSVVIGVRSSATAMQGLNVNAANHERGEQWHGAAAVSSPEPAATRNDAPVSAAAPPPSRTMAWTHNLGDLLIKATQYLRDLARRRGLVFLLLLLGAISASSGFAAYKNATGILGSVDLPALKSAAEFAQENRLSALSVSPAPSTKPQEARWDRLTTPGYAIILYGVSLFSGATRAALECRSAGTSCKKDASFSTVIVVQSVAAFLGLVFVFILAWRLSGAWHIALLTLALSFFMYHGGEHAALIQSAVWIPVFAFLAMMLAVEARLQCRLTMAFAAAVGAGVASTAGALILPSMLVMAPTIALALFWSSGRNCCSGDGGDSDSDRDGDISCKTWRRIALATGPLVGVLAAVGVLVIFFPSSFLQTAIRQLSFDLAHRIGYHDMSSAHIWLASLILPVPGLGGLMQVFVAPETAVKVSSMFQSGNFAIQGGSKIYPLSQAQPGSPLMQYAWLWKNYILGNFGLYLALIPTIAIKGVWAGAGLLGLLGLTHIPRAISYHKVDRRFGVFVTAFAPIVVLFAANVLLSANFWVYNTGLIALYAYAMAFAADHY